jgi:hypothetical protein
MPAPITTPSGSTAWSIVTSRLRIPGTGTSADQPFQGRAGRVRLLRGPLEIGQQTLDPRVHWHRVVA